MFRAIAGGVATGVPLSDWFLIVAGAGSLFIVTGKRHAEQVELGSDSLEHRRTLGEYSTAFLGYVRAVASGVMITAYCLWAFENAAHTGDDTWFRLSIVPFVIAVLRYALVVDQGGGGAPEEVVLSDRVLQVVGVIWAGHVRPRRPWLARPWLSRTERTELLTGWSRTAPTAADARRGARRRRRRRRCSRAPGARGLIARGLGRSYGDAAQNAGGTVLDATHARRLPRRSTSSTGVVRVDAGVSLDAIMRTMVPLGWFVHVTPGTRSSPWAARIAADVHGKNHHVDGSFANHVESFVLHTPKGTVDGHARLRPRAVLGHGRRARPHRRGHRGRPSGCCRSRRR